MIKGTNKFILETFDLPVVVDIISLSDYIGLNPALLYVLSQEDNIKYYKRYQIPKRDGSKRTVFEPAYSLKLIQKWILEEILYKIPVSQYSYGFRKGMSNPLKKNAELHLKNLFILKMDLKNFFPSIDRDRVYYTYNQIGYNPTISNIFTNLCTTDGNLPQGAVTSPYLANLICRQLDKRISKYCDKRGIIYSRYADDLTFSANDRVLLKSIFSMIKKIIENEGFSLNIDKTRFLTPKGKKSITGVVLNSGTTKAPKEIKRKLRAMIHKAVISGDYSSIQQIRGYIAFVNSIEPDFIERIKSYLQSFQNKPVALFLDSVESYNKNRIIKDIPDMIVRQASSFVSIPDEEAFESDNCTERAEYLQKRGLELSMVIGHSGWFREAADDDDLPF